MSDIDDSRFHGARNRRLRSAYFRSASFALAEALNKSVGAEVVANQDTTLGMTTIDAPISDAAWMLATIRAMLRSRNDTSEEERLAAIASTFTRWGDAGPGGFYDSLGGDACNFLATVAVSDPAPNPPNATRRRSQRAAPRLQRGQGALEDPAFYFTPLLVGPTSGGGAFLGAGGRMSWNCYAMSFFDTTDALTLLYDGVLDQDATYQLKVVFNTLDEPGAPDTSGSRSSSSSSLMRLVANNRTTIWPPPNATSDDDEEEEQQRYGYPPTPTQVTVVDVPKSETESGTLRLSCSQYPGVAGNGRTCQISEVWLVPVA